MVIDSEQEVKGKISPRDEKKKRPHTYKRRSYFLTGFGRAWSLANMENKLCKEIHYSLMTGMHFLKFDITVLFPCLYYNKLHLR